MMIVDRLRFVFFAALWTSLGALVAVPPPLVPSLMHLQMVSSSSSESHSPSSSSSSLERVDHHVPTHLELMEKLDSRYTKATKMSGRNRNRIRNFFYARQASKNPCSWVQIEQVLSFLEKSRCCWVPPICFSSPPRSLTRWFCRFFSLSPFSSVPARRRVGSDDFAIVSADPGKER